MIDEQGLRDLVANDADKLRLINVWSTTCGPCVIEFPELVTMHRMYRHRDFEFVTITTDPPARREAALKFLNGQHASTTNYIFAEDDPYKLADALGVEWEGALPFTMLVKPGGEVVYSQMGPIDPLEVRRAIVAMMSRYYFAMSAETTHVQTVAAEEEVNEDESDGAAASAAVSEAPEPDDDGWYALFDGESLDGWRAAENPDSFRVEDGVIVLDGERAHLFYDGPVSDHDFKNFELKLEVMTEPNSNSGIYFHTQYEEEGWPGAGYECQVNNSYDAICGELDRSTAIEDIHETPVKDNEWFEYHIIVNGKQITLKINDRRSSTTPSRRIRRRSRIATGSSPAARSRCRPTTRAAPCGIGTSGSSRCREGFSDSRGLCRRAMKPRAKPCVASGGLYGRAVIIRTQPRLPLAA